MAANREAAYQALFDRLDAFLRQYGSISSSTRRFDHYAVTESMPAMLVTANGQRTHTERGLPAILRLSAQVLFYVRCKEGDPSPETQLNTLVAKVDDALRRQRTDPYSQGADDYWTSLNGTCRSCRPTGDVTLEQGIEGGVGEATIGVEMELPDVGP
jgi:hypothetical protein